MTRCSRPACRGTCWPDLDGNDVCWLCGRPSNPLPAPLPLVRIDKLGGSKRGRPTTEQAAARDQYVHDLAAARAMAYRDRKRDGIDQRQRWIQEFLLAPDRGAEAAGVRCKIPLEGK